MTRVFVCTGVQDGVGATSIALLLAEALRTERPVCLLDADPNRCDQIAWHAAHGQLRGVAQIVAESAAWYEAFSVVHAFCNGSRARLVACTGTLEEMTPAHWDALLELLTRHGMDLVIDAGTRPLAISRTWYQRADAIAVVVDHATQLSVRTQRIVRAMAEMPDIAPRSHLIINRALPGSDAARTDCAWPIARVPHASPLLTQSEAPGYLAALTQCPETRHVTASTASSCLTSDDFCEYVLEKYFAEPMSAAQRSPEAIVDQLLARFPPPLPIDPAIARHQLLIDLDGFGPITPLLQDPQISEILVNGPSRVWIERAGRLETTSAQFRNPRHLQRCIDRLLLHSGRRADVSTPLCDARLAGGERIHVAIAPVAVDGPYISIRRFLPIQWTLQHLFERHAMSAPVLQILQTLVETRRNLLVIGGTGSGKTTLLNALAAHIDPHARIITIEDAAELQLSQPHVVRLEAKIANMEGEGAVTIRDLVRAALRMRPDRIIVGECRSGEALDMLQAMNTGHQGSMTTLHANGPSESLDRLATLVAFSGMTLPHHAVIAQIRAAIDAIVVVQRGPNGNRCVDNVFRILDYHEGHWEVAPWAA